MTDHSLEFEKGILFRLSRKPCHLRIEALNYIFPQDQDSNFWKIWIEQDSAQESGYEEAWWLHITTQQPTVEYYFGPFSQRCDVAIRRSGFIKDLYDEGATHIETEILWCQPTEITIEQT